MRRIVNCYSKVRGGNHMELVDVLNERKEKMAKSVIEMACVKGNLDYLYIYGL